MTIEHMAVVLHHSRAKGSTKLVLLGIANHAGDGGAWPSVATLARYANVTTRSVQKSVAHLVGMGEVRVLRQAGGLPEWEDHLRPNRYEVLVSCPTWCDRSPHHRDTRPTAGPQRGMGLWINGVNPATPPVVEFTPPPVVGDTLTTHRTPPTPGTASPTGHARDSRPCQECGRAEDQCRAAQLTWPTEDHHPYRARPGHATA